MKISRVLFGAWFGFALAIADIHIDDWRFWFLLVPTMVLTAFLD